MIKREQCKIIFVQNEEFSSDMYTGNGSNKISLNMITIFHLLYSRSGGIRIWRTL
jgi:hypothetical protein